MQYRKITLHDGTIIERQLTSVIIVKTSDEENSFGTVVSDLFDIIEILDKKIVQSNILIDHYKNIINKEEWKMHYLIDLIDTDDYICNCCNNPSETCSCGDYENNDK